ncbi:MAG: putative Ig domain-containing protein [Candidatus Sumerlaeia bacterium]
MQNRQNFRTEPFTRAIIKPIACLAFLLLVCGTLRVQAQTDFPPLKSPTKIYTCGNSYTNSTFNTGLEALCEAAGHEIADLKTAGVAGATLDVVWRADQADIKKDLGGEYWDIVTLQSYYNSVERDTEAALKIVAEGRRHNPNIRVLMFTIWPPYSERYDPPAGRRQSWNEQIRDAIVKEYPDTVVQVIPVAIYFKELYEMIDAGRVPNLKSHDLLWRDGGHPGKYGAYPINAMAAAMIFNESPIGYSNISVEGQSIEKETAEVMQKLAWDVLNTYQPALMNAKPTISTLRLQTAVQGLDFSQKLEAINVGDDVKWTVADGNLPEGLSLSQDGTISGKPAEKGAFKLTAQLATAGETSKRDFTLKVSPDLPPTIQTADLPPIPHGEYFIQTLKAENGVGNLAWELADGALPAGVQILPSGFLVGTPGEYGDFNFTLKVSDSHPNGPKSGDKDMTLTVSAPAADTLFLREYACYTEPYLDGEFDEPYWNFDRAETYKLNKTVEGKPTATVEWDAFWWHPNPNEDRAKLFVGARIKFGDLGKTDADSVDIFIDGNNNDEVIYNYDDAHWRYQRKPNSRGAFRPQIIAGYMRFFNSGIAVHEIPDGWQLETYFDNNALGGRGIITAWPAWAVYGFDIAVRQGTEGNIHEQVWKGSAKNPEDTSPFGTIVFKPTNSEPHDVTTILNGDFTDKDFATFSIIGGYNIPKHEWIRQTKNVGGPAWEFKRGEGMIHNNPKSTVAGLMQIIDTPEAGDYTLKFDYKAPKVGFKAAVWGATINDGGSIGVDTLTASQWDDQVQHLDPKEITPTGDDAWHTMEIPIKIADDKPKDMFLVFKTNETGNTGVMIGNVSFQKK